MSLDLAKWGSPDFISADGKSEGYRISFPNGNSGLLLVMSPGSTFDQFASSNGALVSVHEFPEYSGGVLPRVDVSSAGIDERRPSRDIKASLADSEHGLRTEDFAKITLTTASGAVVLIEDLGTKGNDPASFESDRVCEHGSELIYKLPQQAFIDDSHSFEIDASQHDSGPAFSR